MSRIRLTTPRPFGLSRAEALIALAGAALFIALLVPSFLSSKPKAALRGCESSQRVVAAALQSYAADHAGFYPLELADLPPRYLPKIPTCPASGKAPLYDRATTPNAYTVCCAGNHHVRAWALFESGSFGPSSGVRENFPQYTSQGGLLEH